MHPVLVILLTWLAVDVAVVMGMVLVSARRSRDLDAYSAEPLEQTDLHPNL